MPTDESKIEVYTAQLVTDAENNDDGSLPPSSPSTGLEIKKILSCSKGMSKGGGGGGGNSRCQ